MTLWFSSGIRSGEEVISEAENASCRRGFHVTVVLRRFRWGQRVDRLKLGFQEGGLYIGGILGYPGSTPVSVSACIMDNEEATKRGFGLDMEISTQHYEVHGDRNQMYNISHLAPHSSVSKLNTLCPDC